MKENLHFEIKINAPLEIVWDKMLDHESYQEWTKPFDETSYFVGSWEKGSKIKFLSTSGGGGMVSEIAENILHKYISIKHLGEIRNNEEFVWPTPVYENYTYSTEGKMSKVDIDLEFDGSSEMAEMKKMFEVMWPKALEILKEISEKK